MTILHKQSFASGLPIATKTEIDVHHDCTVMLTRIINSKLHQYLITNEEHEGPIKITYIANMCKLDDNIFVMMAETQLPTDEEWEGPPTA